MTTDPKTLKLQKRCHRLRQQVAQLNAEYSRAAYEREQYREQLDRIREWVEKQEELCVR